MAANRPVARRLYDAVRRRTGGPQAPAPGSASETEGPGPGRPAVTVVMAACDTQEAFLEAALGSVSAQQLTRLEVVVVPYGRSSRSAGLARRLATADDRIRVLDEASADLDAARDLGASRARGRFLVFAGAADTLPPTALRALASSLRESGSDLAVGRLTERPPADQTAPLRRLGHQPRRRTTLAEAPGLVADTHPGNRMFRASFWRTAGLAFAGARHDPVLAAYLAAQAVDVLDVVTYRDLHRGDGTPIGQLPNPIAGIEGWLARQRATLALLEASTTGAVRDAWIVDVLEHGAVGYVDNVERADDAQWRALRGHLEELLRIGGDPVWQRLRAETRARAWLVQHDDRAGLVELLASRWFENGDLRTDVEDGVVLADFALPAEVGPLPRTCRILADHETPLRVRLRRVRWVDEETLELDVFAWIEYVGGDGSPPEVEAALVDGHGAELALTVRQSRDPRVNLVARHAYQDYSEGALSLRVPARAVVEASRPGHDQPASWRLLVRYRQQGVTRTGSVTEIDSAGAAAVGSREHAARPVDGRLIHVVRPAGEDGIELTVGDAHEVVLVGAETTGRRVVGALRSDVPLAEVVLRHPEAPDVRCAVSMDGDRQVFDAELPAAGFAEGTTNRRHWRLRAVTADGVELGCGWSLGAAAWAAASPGSELALGRAADGGCEVVETARTPVLDLVDLAGDTLRVRGHWLGAEPAAWRIGLVGSRSALRGEPLALPGGGFELSFALTDRPWGETAYVPAGAYRFEVLVVEGADPIAAVPLVAPELVDRLLEEQLGPRYRLRLHKPGAALQVLLEPAYDEDERGAYAQAVLRSEYAESPVHPIEDRSVYLECYGGRSATDSPRAIAEELVRTRPDLTLHWGVSDASAAVPAGTTPVLLNSREWHRVRTTARYLVTNMDFDRTFRKRPGQQLLQTFHGYPSKTMGLRMWEAKQMTPRRLRTDLERTSGRWDLILTPTPEMDRYYRSEYAYDGPIENRGYPRDDVLAGDGAVSHDLRRRTRALLGITAEQTVVLYAPTWRDDLALDWSSVPLTDHLDLEAASIALGEGFVFLMRGHRFHPTGPGSERLVDVTAYPEVNDLILAADVAVLDYSSLRFDFALTGQPMLFLVPDLAEYADDVRGFLYPFEESAPGPLLRNGEQVVERLRDLDALREEYAAPYAEFNARFNAHQDGHSAERVVAAFFAPSMEASRR